jgi:hypothetical protein
VVEPAAMIETGREGLYKLHYINTAALARLADRSPGRRKEDT